MNRLLIFVVLSGICLCSVNVMGATVEPRTAEEAILQSGDTQWSLVAVGESILQLVVPSYAERLQEHLGITVTPKVWVVNTAQELITQLSEHTPLQEAISEADVLVFQVPVQEFTTYATEVERAISQIVALRSPFEAITRTMHSYASGGLSVNQILAANSYLSEVATKHQIQIAKVFEKFYGISGSLDPVSRGYLTSEPSPQLTAVGVNAIVELIYDIGTGYGLYDCS